MKPIKEQVLEQAMRAQVYLNKMSTEGAWHWQEDAVREVRNLAQLMGVSDVERRIPSNADTRLLGSMLRTLQWQWVYVDEVLSDVLDKLNGV